MNVKSNQSSRSGLLFHLRFAQVTFAVAVLAIPLALCSIYFNEDFLVPGGVLALLCASWTMVKKLKLEMTRGE